MDIKVHTWASCAGGKSACRQAWRWGRSSSWRAPHSLAQPCSWGSPQEGEEVECQSRRQEAVEESRLWRLEVTLAARGRGAHSLRRFSDERMELARWARGGKSASWRGGEAGSGEERGEGVGRRSRGRQASWEERDARQEEGERLDWNCFSTASRKIGARRGRKSKPTLEDDRDCRQGFPTNWKSKLSFLI